MHNAPLRATIASGDDTAVLTDGVRVQVVPMGSGVFLLRDRWDVADGRWVSMDPMRLTVRAEHLELDA